MPIDLVTLAATERDRAVRPLDAPIPGIDSADVVASIVIRAEPRAWQRPATVGFNGTVRTFTPRETIKAEELIRAHIRAAMDEAGTKLDPGAAFGLRCRFFLGPRGRVKDVDNLVKTVCEAISYSAARDDRQIIEVQAVKILHSDDPRSEILLYRAGLDR